MLRMPAVADSYQTNGEVLQDFPNKHKLKRELLSFGVSEQSLFPELESQAAAIVERYSNKYARKKKTA